MTKGSTFDAPGVLAFAHSSTGGNGSQFFVTLAPAPNLNPTPSSKYSIFGNVTEGDGHRPEDRERAHGQRARLSHRRVVLAHRAHLHP